MAFTSQSHLQGMCVCMNVTDQCSTLPDDVAQNFGVMILQDCLNAVVYCRI